MYVGMYLCLFPNSWYRQRVLMKVKKSPIKYYHRGSWRLRLPAPALRLPASALLLLCDASLQDPCGIFSPSAFLIKNSQTK